VQQREAKARPVNLPAADLARIKDLYLRGRYRAAYEVGAAHGPPRAWSGPAGRLIAGRLAMQLGAPKLGRRLHAVAFRESPAYPEAVYYHARFRLERFGPLACWRFCREHTDWSEAAPEIRGDWAALQAFVAARFRDFDRADQFLAQSEAVCPDRPWHFVERSSVLEAQDKPDDALTAARRSLELQPWFRPGVQAVAHMLARKGRAAEAVELLTEASERLESGMVAAQLAALQLDLGHHADAARSIERFADLSPLIEPDVAEWLSARRADVAYLLGNYPAAAEHAKQVGDEDEFYQ
jgi:tetratricopeptide (TPR) repeat protein